MEGFLARYLSSEQRVVLRQFVSFSIVGLIGFFFDTATVYTSKIWVGLYAAGLLGYLVAVTATWWFNRIWTFAAHPPASSILRQWATFVSANFVGFLLNRGVYALLITFSPLCVRYPVLAIAAGIPAGLLSNFHLSRRLVFRAPQASPLRPDRATPDASTEAGKHG